ncbi:hypothetical protein ACJMK2_040276 [Sinanodonta woodiana]|uniref:Laminin G domain-containing protein n=1 Tax=Sinanodonta woodiana TaxID=1069815 RepID=A0ABD3WEI4_SINWO
MNMDEMALVLDNGQLVLHMVVNQERYMARVGKNLSNGEWYLITLQFDQGQYRFYGNFVFS